MTFEYLLANFSSSPMVETLNREAETVTSLSSPDIADCVSSLVAFTTLFLMRSYHSSAIIPCVRGFAPVTMVA